MSFSKRLMALLMLLMLLILPSISRAAPPCSKMHSSFAEIHAVCEHLTKECADVPAEKRSTCGETRENRDGRNLIGCLKGVYGSVKGLVEFLFETAKFLLYTLPVKGAEAAYRLTDPKGLANLKSSTRAEVLSVAQLQGYILREYAMTEKRMGLLGKVTGLADVAATPIVASKIAGPIFNTIATKLEDLVSEEVRDFACYNTPAREELLCGVVADFLIPEAGLFAALKGVKYLKDYPNIARAFSKMQKVIDSQKRIAKIAERAKTISPVVQVAPERSEHVVKAIAKDMHETWREGQRTHIEKFHEVGASDFRPGETARQAKARLEQEGVKGLAISKEGKLTQNINQPADDVLPSITERNNGEPAAEYLSLFNGKKLESEHDFEKGSSDIHEIWMKTNAWQRQARPEVFEPYPKLSPEEQLKDLDVLASVVSKTNPKILRSKAYLDYRASLQHRMIEVSEKKAAEVSARAPATLAPLPEDKYLRSKQLYGRDEVDRELAVPRYEEIGLKLSENGNLDALPTHQTAISHSIETLKERFGITISTKHGLVYAEYGGRKFQFYVEEELLISPKNAQVAYQTLAERAETLQKFQGQGLNVVKPELYLRRGSKLELAGNRYGDENARLIYEARTKQGIHLFVEEGLEGAAGVSHGGGKISVTTNTALHDPAFLREALLHEIKHNSTDQLVVSDRMIEFRSQTKSLPVQKLYRDYMRADEVEARLGQNVAARQKGRFDIHKLTQMDAAKMVEAQKNILQNIKPSELSDGAFDVEFSNRTSAAEGKFTVTTLFKGQPVEVEFPVPIDVSPAEAREVTKKLIEKRLKYLTNIELR